MKAKRVLTFFLSLSILMTSIIPVHAETENPETVFEEQENPLTLDESETVFENIIDTQGIETESQNPDSVETEGERETETETETESETEKIIYEIKDILVENKEVEVGNEQVIKIELNDTREIENAIIKLFAEDKGVFVQYECTEINEKNVIFNLKHEQADYYCIKQLSIQVEGEWIEMDISKYDPLAYYVTDVSVGDYASAGIQMFSTRGERLTGVNGNDGVFVVVLDPGHDPGCTNRSVVNGVWEPDLNWKIAEAMVEELQGYLNVEVYINREWPECPGETDGIECLEARVRRAANLKADLVISLHNNAVGNGDLQSYAQGAESFVTRYPAYQGEATALSEAILAKLEEMGLYNIGVKTRYYGDDAKDTYDDGTGWDYYAINRHSTLMGIPSLLIEHAFMDNSYDLQFLRSDEKLKEMGKRNAQAIIEYYGLQKIIEPSEDMIIEQTTVDILNEDDVKGTFDIHITANGAANSIKNFKIAAWSKADKSNLYWYEAERQNDGTYIVHFDIKNHAYCLGEYELACYVGVNQQNLAYITSVKKNLAIKAGEIITVQPDNKASMNISLSNVHAQGIVSQIYFVVWSEANGQDDMVWYPAVEDGNTYSVNIPYYNHKDIGTYNVHAYVSGKDWNMHFLQKTTFEVNELLRPEVKVIGTNESKGTLKVESSIDCPSNRVQGVYFAVWSQPDQSDLYWYNAQLQEDGLYSAELNIKNHAYHIGKYNIHCYIRDLNGKLVFMDGETHTVKLKAGELTETKDSEGYCTNLVLSDVKAQGLVSQMYFVVWSEANGQDDMIWYPAENNGDSYSANIPYYNHKDTGIYNVHAYISGKDWNMHFLTKTTFEVSDLPESDIQLKSQDEKAGKFVVSAFTNRPESSFKELYVEAWTEKDKTDLYRYSGQIQQDGTYKVQIDVKNHKYNMGKYQIACYVKEHNGKNTKIASMSHDVKIQSGDFIEKKIADSYSSELVLKDVKEQGLVSQMYFVVWSEANGQDDMIWYPAEKNGDGYSANIPYYNHKDTGIYNVHAYISGKDWKMHMIKATQFEVSELPKNIVEIMNLNHTNGTFDVNIELFRDLDKVSEVYVPVWTKPDQNDIKWYAAKKQSDGSFKVSVDALNHKWNSGKYCVHVYVRRTDGELEFIQAESVVLDLPEKQQTIGE